MCWKWRFSRPVRAATAASLCLTCSGCITVEPYPYCPPAAAGVTVLPAPAGGCHGCPQVAAALPAAPYLPPAPASVPAPVPPPPAVELHEARPVPPGDEGEVTVPQLTPADPSPAPARAGDALGAAILSKAARRVPRAN